MLAAAILALSLSIIATGSDDVPGAAPYPVNGYLCESAKYAMAFATAIANGADEESAKNVVGATAKREVCGRYVGIAVVQEEKTVVDKGIVYRLIALRFQEDKKIAWLAESVFDVQDHSSMQHL